MGWGHWFFPLPGKQTLPGSLAQLPPPNYHTHPCPQGLSKRGHARLGGDRPFMGCQGTRPSGMQRWEGCPRWGGHQYLTLAERRGRPPPYPSLPDDGPRSAPLAWLAPV